MSATSGGFGLSTPIRAKTGRPFHRFRHRQRRARLLQRPVDPRIVATGSSMLGRDQKTLHFTSDRTLPIAFPRTRSQTQADLDRIQLWDNGNSNVWTIAIGLPAQRTGT